jgi:hypothetical protein
MRFGIELLPGTSVSIVSPYYSFHLITKVKTSIVQGISKSLRPFQIPNIVLNIIIQSSNSTALLISFNSGLLSGIKRLYLMPESES